MPLFMHPFQTLKKPSLCNWFLCFDFPLGNLNVKSFPFFPPPSLKLFSLITEKAPLDLAVCFWYVQREDALEVINPAFSVRGPEENILQGSLQITPHQITRDESEKVMRPGLTISTALFYYGLSGALRLLLVTCCQSLSVLPSQPTPLLVPLTPPPITSPESLPQQPNST